ncbi:hypothetical protein KIN20_008708 [Parelaphostrongylus tenuis]|uniref:Uncharacterized protein n=1 Tax=Parelaphostrongylus tenuis TaxID=148309 RepID=A0AAD5M559_PARTN|nr:hypothetical protein KIN20_008708 [Parelaphostrongylus tenuis]
MESTIPKPENANADSKEDIVDLYRGPDTKLEENASDVESVPYSEGGGDEEEGYEASVATDLEIVSDCEMNAGGVDHPDNTIDDHVPDHDVTEVSPYSLRPRIPHIEGNSSLGSSETSLTQARSPKKSSKHRARNRRRNNQSRVKFNWTLEPVEDPPPDDLESSSLISGEPVIFKLEELEQLRIQLEQHVQLLTQSVVMCYHDRRSSPCKGPISTYDQ